MSTRSLQEDLAGAIATTLAAGTAVVITNGEIQRNEPGTPLAVLLPVDQFQAYEAFLTAREAFAKLLR